MKGAWFAIFAGAFAKISRVTASAQIAATGHAYTRFGGLLEQMQMMAEQARCFL